MSNLARYLSSARTSGRHQLRNAEKMCRSYIQDQLHILHLSRQQLSGEGEIFLGNCSSCIFRITREFFKVIPWVAEGSWVSYVYSTSLPFFLKLMTYRLNNLSLPLGLQMRFVAAPYLLQTQEPWLDRVMCVPTLSPRKKVCWKGTAQTLALGTLSSPLLDGYSAPLA